MRLPVFSWNGVLVFALIWFAVLACHVSDVIASRGGQTPTTAATRPVPTFTLFAQIIPPTATNPPPPTIPAPPPPPSPRPTTRRPPTRAPTPTKPPTPAPIPPTPDPYAGFYYKPSNKGCVSAPNTRIQGTVTENGVKKNGVTVRVSLSDGGPPVIDDFVTGTDPTDYKHYDPSLQGQYRLGLFEGQQNAGNWWVFILDSGGLEISPGIFVNTQDGGGCNTATIDFYH